MEQREQKPNLFGLCRVVTEEDKVSRWSSERRGQPMEQREERPSLLGLSRVVTEEDKVKLAWAIPSRDRGRESQPTLYYAAYGISYQYS